MRDINAKERVYIGKFKALVQFMRGMEVMKCYPEGMEKAAADNIAAKDAEVADLEKDLAAGLDVQAQLEAGKTEDQLN
jgi:hypothetical protein